VDFARAVERDQVRSWPPGDVRFTFLGVGPDLPLDPRRDEGDKHRREKAPARGDVQGPEDPAPTTKLYAGSFKGSNHLRRIQHEPQAIIQRVFREGGRGTA
jgi:hypothetical protein